MGPQVGNAADPIVTRLVAEDKVPFYKKPNLRIMYIWLFTCCMGVEMTSGFDSQLINSLQFSPMFNKYFGGGLKNDKDEYMIEANILGFLSASYQLGSILGVPIAPWMNQRFGRRWCIMAGSWIMVVGAIVQGMAQHIAMYIVARILLGIGIVFCIIAGAALIAELAHPKERPVLTSLFNASWFIGSIIACAISLATVEIQGDWAWRIPSLLQITPSLLQIATVFLLPESPRYLISHDRDDEAYAILVKYHAEGDANSMLVQAEMAQMKSTIKMEFEASKESWLDLLRSAGMRRRVLITVFIGLFTQMSGNSLLSYYSGKLFGLMGIDEPGVKSRINIANQCWSFINATILALVITRFRRRWMYMISATSMLLVFIAMTVSFERLSAAEDAGGHNSQAATSALFWYFAYSPAYNMGNNALTYTYLVELWPYAHRSRGIGAMQIFGKAGGFFSTYVNPHGIDNLGWGYFAVYCGWIFFELGFIYWFYPETYKRTLEELAFLFEDAEYNDRAAAAVEKSLAHNGDDQMLQQTTTIEESHVNKSNA